MAHFQTERIAPRRLGVEPWSRKSTRVTRRSERHLPPCVELVSSSLSDATPSRLSIYYTACDVGVTSQLSRCYNTHHTIGWNVWALHGEGDAV